MYGKPDMTSSRVFGSRPGRPMDGNRSSAVTASRIATDTPAAADGSCSAMYARSVARLSVAVRDQTIFIGAGRVPRRSPMIQATRRHLHGQWCCRHGYRRGLFQFHRSAMPDDRDRHRRLVPEATTVDDPWLWRERPSVALYLGRDETKWMRFVPWITYNPSCLTLHTMHIVYAKYATFSRRLPHRYREDTA